MTHTGPKSRRTPLFRKLGLKPGQAVLILNAPKPYAEFFRELPELNYLKAPDRTPADFIHLFADTFEELDKGLEKAKPRLQPNGMLWISWPKKSSELSSEIGKFEVMQAGQAIGLVDVKVASIDETWSGHKFVVPLKNRPVS
jgi:hypothetical protein